MSQTNKVRVFIITASIAAVTATGAWYGAGLKARQEFHQEKKQIIESTTAEKIAQLERTKIKFVQERRDLAAKIERLTTGPSSSPPATSEPGVTGKAGG